MYGVRRWALAALVGVTAVACSGDETRQATGATVPTEATTSTTLSVEQEVEQAYLRAFDIYVKAVRDLDTSQLAKAYADVALSLRTDEVEDLRAAGTPVRYEIEDRSLAIRLEGPSRAVVEVKYRNHSVLLDADGKPLEPDPNETLVVTYVLEERNGQWFVIGIG